MTELKRKKLTQARLKELLDYNPETGFFTWRISKGSRGKMGQIAGGKNKKLGYIMIILDSQIFYAHRLAFFYMEGVFPKHIKVDHRNRIKTDNRWSNLRLVSNQCNARNCSLAKNNKSGIMGVSIIKSSGLWRASILGGRDTKNLGHYKNRIDAAKARWEAEKKYNYPNCQTSSSAYRYLKDNGVL